jgi:hypothetical protein
LKFSRKDLPHSFVYTTTFISILDDQPHRIHHEKTSDDHDDSMSPTKEPVMTMTLKSETEFPKALKNLMLSMGMQGEAVYKGFPMIDEGEEYLWVQLHLYKDKEDTHKI